MRTLLVAPRLSPRDASEVSVRSSTDANSHSSRGARPDMIVAGPSSRHCESGPWSRVGHEHGAMVRHRAAAPSSRSRVNPGIPVLADTLGHHWILVEAEFESSPPSSACPDEALASASQCRNSRALRRVGAAHRRLEGRCRHPPLRSPPHRSDRTGACGGARSDNGRHRGRRSLRSESRVPEAPTGRSHEVHV